MKKILTAALLCGLLGSSLSAATASQKIVIGGTCIKAGESKTVGKLRLICTKSGKKLIWTEKKSSNPSVAASKSPTPTFTPAKAPEGFNDLYENRAGISYSAWKKVNESISLNTPKLGDLKILTGPSTSPLFDKYLEVLQKLSRAFPATEEPEKIIVIRFSFRDISWAERELKNSLSSDDYNALIKNDSMPIANNCTSNNCMGSRQITTNSGIALILQGVATNYNTLNFVDQSRFTTGMLEVHEYFHSLQRIPMLGINLDRTDWPRAWIREGSAEFIQNAVIFGNDYEKYKKFITMDCANETKRLTENDVSIFLGAKTDEEIAGKYPNHLDYCLGAYAVEVLVALKGPGPIINLYKEMSNRVGFESAFRNVYEEEWKSALPILAKAIYSNARSN